MDKSSSDCRFIATCHAWYLRFLKIRKPRIAAKLTFPSAYLLPPAFTSLWNIGWFKWGYPDKYPHYQEKFRFSNLMIGRDFASYDAWSSLVPRNDINRAIFSGDYIVDAFSWCVVLKYFSVSLEIVLTRFNYHDVITTYNRWGSNGSLSSFPRDGKCGKGTLAEFTLSVVRIHAYL